MALAVIVRLFLEGRDRAIAWRNGEFLCTCAEANELLGIANFAVGSEEGPCPWRPLGVDSSVTFDMPRFRNGDGCAPIVGLVYSDINDDRWLGH
jgi:hypothetical protein